MVLVVDNYGGLAGIVTRTDLLEAIAGDLPDTKDEERELKELGDGALLPDGSMSIYDAQQRLNLSDLPDGNFNTLAGLVLTLFRIPRTGEHVQWGGWRFEVSELEAWRINKVLAQRINGEELVVMSAR